MAVRFSSNLPEVVAAFERACRGKLTTAGNIGRTSVLETLSGSRSGAAYTVPGTRTPYTASAPGEAPASRTGRLRQSYAVSEVYEDDGQLVIAVGSDVEYAVMLERGTRSMAPRPHLEPAIRKAQSQINAALEELWL